MYRIIVVMLACASLSGCTFLPAKSDALGQGPKAEQELRSDVATCERGPSVKWKGSTQYVSNNDTLVILCEFSDAYTNDKTWSCIWDPKEKSYDCRYKQSSIQVAKDHIPIVPSERYDLFCGPCVGGWK